MLERLTLGSAALILAAYGAVFFVSPHGAYVNAAWIFVAFRALHSAVHCTLNPVMLRFHLHLISTVAVRQIAVRAALAHF